MRRAILILNFILALTACNFYRDKTLTQADDQTATDVQEDIEVSYQQVHEKVFLPKCISCHGDQGGINLETYEAVFSHLEAINQAVLKKKTMPKNTSLSTQQKKLLSAWIQAGAPRDSTTVSPPESPSNPENPGETETPTPSPAPIPNPRDPTPAPPVQDSELTYKFVNRSVFAPRCIRCHGDSGGVNLQSYQQVKSQLSAIKRTVFNERSMPQDGALTSRQENVLKKWIEKGAPYGAGAPPLPTPSPTPTATPVVTPTPTPDPNPTPTSTPEPTPSPTPVLPLESTFDSIKLHILEKRCLQCHTEGGSGKRIPLSTREVILNSPLELVIPGNPDESGIVIAIERTDAKRMPPPRTGEPLTAEQIKAIRDWILNGATD